MKTQQKHRLFTLITQKKRVVKLTTVKQIRERLFKFLDTTNSTHQPNCRKNKLYYIKYFLLPNIQYCG